MLPSFIDYLKIQIDTKDTPEKREYSISIPGAERINIIFDESKFHENDTITITSNNVNYFEEKGMKIIDVPFLTYNYFNFHRIQS